MTGEGFRLEETGQDEKRYDGERDERHFPIVYESDDETGEESGYHVDDSPNASPKTLGKNSDVIFLIKKTF